MDIADEYRKQFQWRSWKSVLDGLPSLSGRTVLDLGCAIGDQARELVARGASVIAVDGNPDLLRVARAQALQGVEFRERNLRDLEDMGAPVDGLWSSFTAAYFTDFDVVLASWKKLLKPGGWIALTEIDDFFNHGPLSDLCRSRLQAYVQDSLQASRYDFNMGHKLETYLREAGFTISESSPVEDQEFSFHGPASDGVFESWRLRLDRMKLLRDFCGSDYEGVRDEFLQCLARSDHRSHAQVIACLATT